MRCPNKHGATCPAQLAKITWPEYKLAPFPFVRTEWQWGLCSLSRHARGLQKRYTVPFKFRRDIRRMGGFLRQFAIPRLKFQAWLALVWYISYFPRETTTKCFLRNTSKMHKLFDKLNYGRYEWVMQFNSIKILILFSWFKYYIIFIISKSWCQICTRNENQSPKYPSF